MTNILNMIFGSLRIFIPLSISLYYLIKKGFKGNVAQISLLQMIAFINAVFFLPTLIKFFKRLYLNKRIEKIFKTASEKNLKDNDICIICRLKMYPKMAKKLPCGHCYHLECLERWIGENETCPICLEKISDLLAKEEMKKKQKKKRTHRGSKSENENNVFNYNDLNDDNNIEEEEEKVDQHADDEQRYLENNYNNDEQRHLGNNFKNDDMNFIDNNNNDNDDTKEIVNQENVAENNDVDDVEVIDLDKISAKEDQNDYDYYSDYYDEFDHPDEAK